MAYTTINWEDSPSTKTPINAENLNQMDKGILDAHKQLGAFPEWSKNEEKPKYTAEDVGTYTKEEIDIYKANSILSKTSGTTILTTDSAAVKPNITTFGKSAQRQYKGQQLLDVRNRKSQPNISVDSDGWITLTADNTSGSAIMHRVLELLPSELLEVNKQYLVVCEMKSNTLNTDITVASSIDVNYKGQFNGNFRIPASNTTGVYTSVLTTRDDFSNCTTLMRTLAQANAGTSGSVTFRLSIIEDTTITADTFVYEPYVGNAPSPSLEYKQEVTPIGESGSVTEKLLSGNIYNSSFQKTVITIGGSTTENNGIYSITTSNTDVYVNNQADKGSAYQFNRFGWLMSIPDGVSEIGITITNERFNKNFISFYDEDKISLGFQLFSKSVFSLETSKMPEGTKYFTLRFGKGDAVIGTTYKTSVMVNYGEPLPYEPYSEQPLTYQTPNGLRGIPLGTTIPDAIKNSPIHMSGVYWDEVEQQYYFADTKNGDGKDVQRIGEYVFTGKEDVAKRNITSADVYQKIIRDANFGDAGITLPVLCTHYIGRNNGRKIGEIAMLGHGYISFGFAEYETTTVDDVQTKFKELYDTGNPVTVNYILAEPIITDTSEEELEQYNSVHMNYPNTTIVNDAGAYMEVEYVCDTEIYIEQNYVPKDEFEDLKTQVAEIQAQLVNA